MNEAAIHSEGARRKRACDAIAHPDGQHGLHARAAQYSIKSVRQTALTAIFRSGHGRQTTT
jgi:hypothetical protein